MVMTITQQNLQTMPLKLRNTHPHSGTKEYLNKKVYNTNLILNKSGCSRHATATHHKACFASALVLYYASCCRYALFLPGNYARHWSNLVDSKKKKKKDEKIMIKNNHLRKQCTAGEHNNGASASTPTGEALPLKCSNVVGLPLWRHPRTSLTHTRARVYTNHTHT